MVLVYFYLMLGGGNIRREPVPFERQLYGGEFSTLTGRLWPIAVVSISLHS